MIFRLYADAMSICLILHTTRNRNNNNRQNAFVLRLRWFDVYKPAYVHIGLRILLFIIIIK